VIGRGPARGVTATSRTTRFASLLLLAACGGTLDAGKDEPQGLLPVDGRNPTLLIGDGYVDNWQGEYALLYAATERLSLVGIVVDTSPTWTNIDDLMAGWRQMTAAANQSGMKHVPTPMASIGPALVRPADGNIDSTQANDSEGARLIVDASKELSRSYRPLVVLTGCHLTDVADAYLLDPTVVDRVVVVAALGSVTSTGGLMGIANGEMDPWADAIVASKFTYVQVSTYYDPMSDVPADLLPQLPATPFTTWIKNKQPKVWDDLDAADQNAVSALVLPQFVTATQKVTLQAPTSGGLPSLVKDDGGSILLVTQVSGAIATSTLWQMLLESSTYAAK
jgi:hypothetical protein